MKKLTIPAIALAATLALSSCNSAESQKKSELKITETEQADKPQKEIIKTSAKIKDITKPVDKNRKSVLETLKAIGLYDKELEVLMPLFDKIKTDPESLRPSNFKEDVYTEEDNIHIPGNFWNIDKKDMLKLYKKNKESLLKLINFISPAGKRVALEWVGEYEILANHKLSRAKLDLIKSSINKSIKKRKKEGYPARAIHAQGASLISSYTNGVVSVLDARAYLFQREYGEEIKGTLNEIRAELEK